VNTSVEQNKMKPEPARLSCTYAEAVYLLHQKGITTDHAAMVLGYIFGRDQDVVMVHLLNGMP
jgi:hypothetical protein